MTLDSMRVAGLRENDRNRGTIAGPSLPKRRDSESSGKVKQEDSIGVATVTSSAINVRSGSGTNYPRIGGLTKGKSVAIYQEKNGWLKIKYNSDYGWINKTYTNYKNMSSTKYMEVSESSINLRELNHWATAEGVDAKDLSNASKFVAFHCVGSTSQRNCTRGTSLFMQLASYARYEANGGEKVSEIYKTSTRADRFGDGSSNGNIRSDVSKEYSEKHVDLIESQSTTNEEIKKNLKKNGDYVTFNYQKLDKDTGKYKESWHIVFLVDGKYYSDFKQSSPTGVASGAKHFNNINYYTH